MKTIDAETSKIVQTNKGTKTGFLGLVKRKLANDLVYLIECTSRTVACFGSWLSKA